MKGQEWYQTEQVADAYEEKRFSGGGRLIDRREKQAVLDGVAPIDEQRILELACGTGRFSVMLAERGADITGLDISPAMLSQARRKSRASSVRDHIEFLRGDAGRLPFPDDTFDTVFAVRFFHLADTPAQFLSEMQRVARNRVFFDTFNARSARSVYNWLLPMGSRLYTAREVHRLLDGAGLSEVAEAVLYDRGVPFGPADAVETREVDELAVAREADVESLLADWGDRERRYRRAENEQLVDRLISEHRAERKDATPSELLDS